MNNLCSVSIDELKNDSSVNETPLTKEEIFDQDIESLKGHTNDYSENAKWMEENLSLQWLFMMYALHRGDPNHLGEVIAEEFDRLLRT